jgi:hypothetical protein
MSLRIVDVKGVSDDKKRDIVSYLVDSFQKSVVARQAQVEGKYQKWLKNYDAVPAQLVRSTPFPNASNFMPQLIRMHTDILTARLLGILYGTRPFWRPTTFLSNVPADQMNSLAAWMQYISFNRIQMYPTVDTIIHDGFKVGTVVCKKWWNEETLFIGGEDNETQVDEKDLRLDVVPFEDFYPFPITAKRLEFCEAKFQRIRLTKPEVEYRRDSNLWNKEAANLLLIGPNTSGGSSAQQQTAIHQGISLTPDVGRPYDAIEAHFTYQLSPGKKYALIAVFNPKVNTEKSLLRFYYKPGSNPFDLDFIDFRPMPKGDSFYGECVPQILEDSQEEQAQIHNGRRDSNLITNVPGWKKKRYSDVGSPSIEWYPGKVFEVDSMDDLEPLMFPGNYNSMVDEEQFLLTLAERYTGVSPAMQGMGAGVNGKKGSYASQGTLAMIAEGNRRIDIYLKRMRIPFNKIGKGIFTAYRDFGDPNEWSQWGEHAANLKQLFQKDGALTGGNTFFELSASDAGANRETDRSGLLLMANTMSAYYHELVQAAQTIASAPPNSPFTQIMLQVMDGARDLANRLLFVFDIGDREKLLPDLRKVFPGGDQPGMGPGAQPGATAQQGLPQPQGDVSVGGVQDLSAQLTQLTSGLRQGPNGGQGLGGSPVQ